MSVAVSTRGALPTFASAMDVVIVTWFVPFVGELPCPSSLAMDGLLLLWSCGTKDTREFDLLLYVALSTRHVFLSDCIILDPLLEVEEFSERLRLDVCSLQIGSDCVT